MRLATNPRVGFIFCLMIFPELIGQQQPTSLQKDRQIIVPAHPQWENRPTDEAAAQPTTADGKALRQARSEAFNDKLGLAPKLEANNSNMVGVGGTTDRGYIPPLPVDSSAIVVGKVILVQSHLSADHTAIYSELKIQIENVLQNKAGNLAASSSLDILERGGTVTFEGKILHRPVSESSGVLDIGQRYVKIEFEFESRNFLKHRHDVKGSDLIVCWEHNWPECPLEVIELKSLVGH